MWVKCSASKGTYRMKMNRTPRLQTAIGEQMKINRQLQTYKELWNEYPILKAWTTN